MFGRCQFGDGESLCSGALRVVRPDLAPDLTGEHGERHQPGAGIVEVFGGGREPSGDPCNRRSWTTS
jgi:hypothetical protein